MVATVENVLGCRLPAAYVDLLRVQNGGCTSGFVFPTSRPTSWADDHVALDELFGIGRPDAEVGHQNIYDTVYMTSEWGLPQGQVLLAGGGHYWITLDYRNGTEPAVSWIDVEVGQDLTLAGTFAAFLGGLRPASAVDESGHLVTE